MIQPRNTTSADSLALGGNPPAAYALASALATANAAIAAVNDILATLNAAATDPDITSDGSGHVTFQSVTGTGQTSSLYDVYISLLGGLNLSGILGGVLDTTNNLVVTSVYGLVDSGINTSGIDELLALDFNTAATDPSISSVEGVISAEDVHIGSLLDTAMSEMFGAMLTVPNGNIVCVVRDLSNCFFFDTGLNSDNAGTLIATDATISNLGGLNLSGILGGVLDTTGNLVLTSAFGLVDSGINNGVLMTNGFGGFDLQMRFGVFGVGPTTQQSVTASPGNDFETQVLTLLQAYGLST